MTDMNTLRAVKASLRLLDRRDRRVLGLAAVAQMATALLDLLGVVLLGLVGALSVASLDGQPVTPRIELVISSLGLAGLSDEGRIGAFAGAAAGLLLFKSLVSPLLMRRVFRFLARRDAIVASRLSAELLSRPLTFVQKRTSQVTAAALIEGVGAAISTLLGQMVVAASETTLLIVLSVALLVVNPPVAVCVIVVFAAVGFGLQRTLGYRTAALGAQRVNADIASRSTVQEALGAYRELCVLNRRSNYVARLAGLRGVSAQAFAEMQFIHLVPKYVSEMTLVLGAFALAGVLFATQSAAAAAGTFALFLAAATRIMPALLRLQAATLTMRAATGQATPAYTLVEEFGNATSISSTANASTNDVSAPARRYPGFAPTIRLDDVTFTYPGASVPAIKTISLAIKQGQSVALVGQSGAGKSTLADLILGVLGPDSGNVSVSGLAPSEAVSRWPGSISYVPQSVTLTADSVRANVALGLPNELIEDEVVWSALGRAQLAGYVHDQIDGLDTQVGEQGLRLSGGQRQRLGIARAVYSDPRLLVLDEATSALDAETEQLISEMLDDLDADVTTVIIAHRLSTVRHVDVVVYMAEGRILAIGTFDEVCDQIPALHRQATLMGLKRE